MHIIGIENQITINSDKWYIFEGILHILIEHLQNVLDLLIYYFFFEHQYLLNGLYVLLSFLFRR